MTASNAFFRHRLAWFKLRIEQGPEGGRKKKAEGKQQKVKLGREKLIDEKRQKLRTLGTKLETVSRWPNSKTPPRIYMPRPPLLDNLQTSMQSCKPGHFQALISFEIEFHLSISISIFELQYHTPALSPVSLEWLVWKQLGHRQSPQSHQPKLHVLGALCAHQHIALGMFKTR